MPTSSDDRYPSRDGAGPARKKAKKVEVKDEEEDEDEEDSQITIQSVKDEILNGQMSTRCNSSLFVFKLFEMATTEDYAPAIGFSKNGLSLELRDTEALGPILLKYFKHSNISSFVRQLNNYGFKTIASGPQLQSFAHPQFFREGKHCLESITRTSAKASKKSKVELIRDIQDGENEYRKQIHALEAAYQELLQRIQVLQAENESLKHLRGETVGGNASSGSSTILSNATSRNGGGSSTISNLAIRPSPASGMPLPTAPTQNTVNQSSAPIANPPPVTSVGALGFAPVAFTATKSEIDPYQQLFPNQSFMQSSRSNPSTGQTMTTDDDGEFLESLIVINDADED